MAGLAVIAVLGLMGCRTTAAPAARLQPVVAAPAVATVTDADLLAEAIRLIEPFEGRRHRVYNDGFGNLTIGVGFNLDRGNAKETLAQLLPGVSYRGLRAGSVKLTDAQIDTLLRHDAEQALASAREHVPNFDALPHEAKLVLVDMSFNLGSISQWPDLRAALAAADFEAAAVAMDDSRWRHQTGRRADHLIEVMRTVSNHG